MSRQIDTPSQAPKSPLHVMRDPRRSSSHGVDDLFRSIYTMAGTSRNEIVAITSAISGEGKTAIALGLAVTLAQDFPDINVALVETDLARPVLAADLGVTESPGLSDALTTERDLRLLYRTVEVRNLRVVPAGSATITGARLVRSSRMSTVLAQLRTENDVVILDLPAVLANSDTLMLADLADAIVFVVRSGVTPAAMVNEAIGVLDERKLRGVVLNAADSAAPAWARRLAGV
jgi:non-specific protein-tyrosine kinase